ncbi:snoRNA-binding rRNA-processing protein [Pichia kluyveri]|uniref:mRNA 3'-end-processing protein RNA14 n=1 Tax=Pichia kluyveri TaxID=36015 RepID=A0AAV5R9Z5_PICKL|nr:snoRNA-binding rRNA-processing protein [Pichia kluyveri]
MSDKARYALEKSIPELEDLEKRGLFQRKEINMIVRRRTDFEHRISGRGSKPKDYLLYIKFEKTLDKLRKKRIQRLKDHIDMTPSISNWSISQRILIIFKKATNKFPSDMELWANYLKFARKQESVKVVYDIYSKLLSLQPRNIDVWLSGAKWEYEYNKNVKGARALFKRCLRFNLNEERVWIEFIKFELNYLSKLLTRRKLLQLVSERSQIEDLENESKKEGTKNDDDIDVEDIVTLNVGDDEINSELNALPEMNVSTLGSIEDNPVLRGDLIMTLYNVFIETMIKNLEKEYQHNNQINIKDNEINDEKYKLIMKLSNKILSLIDKFDILDRIHMCDYIIDDLNKRFENDINVLLLKLTLSLRYVSIDDDEFINKLQENVKLYQSWKSKVKIDDKIKEKVRESYVKYLNDKYLIHSQGETQSLLQLLLKKL